MVISQLELYKNIKDVYKAKKMYIYNYLSNNWNTEMYKRKYIYNYVSNPKIKGYDISMEFETIIEGLSGYQISRQEYEKICKLFVENHKISYEEFEKEIYCNNYPEITFDDYIKYYNIFNSI